MTACCRVQLKCDGTRWRRVGKWRGNWRMDWVASTLHTTTEHGVSSITTADAHTSPAGSRLNWRPCRLKLTRPFRRKTKSGFCACAITFQTQSTVLRIDTSYACNMTAIQTTGYICLIIGAFAELRKRLLATSCLSVRMEQLGSHWADFYEFWYLSIFRKCFAKIQASLKSDKYNGYFTRRPMCIDDISLNYS